MTKIISIIFAVVLLSFKFSSFEKTFKHIILPENAKKESLIQMIKEEYKNGKVPVLYYSAEWCPSCKGFKAKIKIDLNAKIALKDLTIFELEYNDNPKSLYHELTGERRIIGVPMFTKVNENGDQLNRISGAGWLIQNPQRINEFVSKIKENGITFYFAKLNNDEIKY